MLRGLKIFFFIFFFFCAFSVQAAINVNPPVALVNLAPGEYYSRDIVIFRPNAESDIKILPSILDSEIKEWIDPYFLQPVTLQTNNAKAVFNLKIKIPINVNSGRYNGVIEFVEIENSEEQKIISRSAFNLTINILETTKNNKCIEYDNGLNYSKKSVIKKDRHTKEDHCLDKQKLLEYFCQNGNIMEKEYICPELCWSGECIVANKGTAVNKINFNKPPADYTQIYLPIKNRDSEKNIKS
ncbi:hypothetical protein KAS41_04920, partial [Candidatus Parcubacteria bacterium]|nr:hypothetical protein [Candidatus Parcubacteria bacterium]